MFRSHVRASTGATSKITPKRALATLVLSAMIAALPAIAEAATTVVHPQAMSGWEIFNEDLNGSNAAPEAGFVNGPAAPPIGVGSFRQFAREGDRTTLRTASYNGDTLASLLAGDLSFATYTNDTAPTILTPAFKLSVDADGNGSSDTTLVFEPYEQVSFNPTMAATQTATWQTWDLEQGVWWSTNTVNMIPGGVGGTRQTLADWNVDFGGAATVALLSQGGVRIENGATAAWPDVDANIDAVKIGADEYDFETFVSNIDCNTLTNDIAAIQAAIDGSPNGSTIRLNGTCDIAAAPAHGGSTSSNPAAALLIRPNPPINGLTIESATPQSATIVGSGTQAAFVVAPGNSNVTIRGLRFANVARAVVAINSANTTVGASGSIANADANRIIGGPTMDSAILGLATDGIGWPSPSTQGEIKISYSGGTATYASAGSLNLTNFAVRGNYISYDPPGSPTTSTDVVAIDVRQRSVNRVNGVTISANAVGMFASEFPNTNINGINLHSFSPDAYGIRNVAITGNNLGRVEELPGNPGDVNAAGRVGIKMIGVEGFTISGNGVRARLSPTAIAMPGGGVVVSDSANGTITDNGIITLADPSTLASDMGAIGIIDNLAAGFGGAARAQTTDHIVVRNNIIGIVSDDGGAPVGSQRGIVVNGASHVAVDNNEVKFSSDDALNIGVQIQGPGSVTAPGPVDLPRTVTDSVLCGNDLDGTTDDVDEVTFGGGASSIDNHFPGGNGFAGNDDCGAAAELLQVTPAHGSSNRSANVPNVTARYNRDLMDPPASSIVLRDKTGTAVAGVSTLSGPTSVTGGKRSVTFTPTASLSQLASPYTAEITATTQGAPAATTTITFLIDDTAPAAPTIGTPANGSFTNAQPVRAIGTAEGNSTVEIVEGATVVGSGTAAANGSYDIALSYGPEEASHTIVARARDAAGNVSANSVAVTFTHDTEAPDAPIITIPAGDLTTSVNTVSLTGTTTEDGTVIVYDGATQVATTSAVSNNWSVTLNAVADGEHVYTAKLRDAATNLSAASNERRITIDTAGPAVPTIQVSPLPVNAANDQAITILGVAEPGSTINVSVKDVDLTEITAGPLTADAEGDYATLPLDLSSLDDGVLAITVKAKDAANNEATGNATVTKDTQAPAAPTAAIAPDPVNGQNQTAVAVNGTGEAGSTANVIVSSSTGTATVSGTAEVDELGNYSFAFDATPLGDGTLTAEVSLTDAFENTGASTSAEADKDTMAPGAPTINTPAEGAVVTTTTITVTGGAGPNAFVQVYEGDTLLGSGTANTTGAWSAEVTIAAGDGPRTIRARQRDEAGNQGTAFATRTFILNVEAPAVILTDPADEETKGAVPEVTAVYSELLDPSGVNTLEVKNVLNTIVAGTVTVEDDTITFTPASAMPQAGSPYTATTKGTDLGGTTSAPYSWQFSIDTTAPGAPVITTPAEGTTLTNPLVTISGTAEAGSTVEVLEGTSVVGTDEADGTGAWSVQANFANGQHTVSATATDAYGNESTASQRTFTVNFDNVAPNAPVIASPAEGATVNSFTVSISGTAEADSTVVVKEGTTTIGTDQADAAGNWSLSGTFANGSHTISATATDGAGNISPAATRTFTVAVDTTPPGTPVITQPAEGATVPTTSVSISGTAEPGSTVKVYEGATQVATATASAGGTWATSASFAPGAHAITATATDGAGNTSAPTAARNFTVAPDTTPPAAPTITTPAEGSEHGRFVTVSGTAEASALVKVKEGTQELGTVRASSSGAWSMDLTFSDGSHTIKAIAIDAANNVSPESAARTFTVDASRPSVAFTTGDNAIFLPTDTFAISGTATDNRKVVKVELVFRDIRGVVVARMDATLTPADGGPSVTWTATPTLGPGRYSVTANAIDAKGERSAGTSISFTKLSL